mmetsp:Transcript_132996/g.323255  ORF Transcript_132996/g.323255 Transcript_132996/m.323255 type:complete len:213 (+) Transcript_132996:990-1628(+)
MRQGPRRHCGRSEGQSDRHEVLADEGPRPAPRAAHAARLPHEHSLPVRRVPGPSLRRQDLHVRAHALPLLGHRRQDGRPEHPEHGRGPLLLRCPLRLRRRRLRAIADARAASLLPRARRRLLHRRGLLLVEVHRGGGALHPHQPRLQRRRLLRHAAPGQLHHLCRLLLPHLHGRHRARLRGGRLRPKHGGGQRTAAHIRHDVHVLWGPLPRL